MQALTIQCQNFLECQALQSTAISSPENEMGLTLFSRDYVLQLAMILSLSSLLLFTYLSATWVSILPSTPSKYKDPPQMPYLMPVVGNLISYLLDAAGLGTVEASDVVRPN